MTPLEKRTASLEQKVQDLERHIARQPPPAEFTPYMGALFKRIVGDEYEVCLYCPRCIFPAGPIPGGLFRCESCRITLDVGGSDLRSIIYSHVIYVGKTKPATRKTRSIFEE